MDSETEGLVELAKRVDQWRQQGGGAGSRMPEELWDAAVKVAVTQGVYRTARAARLQYAQLKSRVARAAQRGSDTGRRCELPAVGFLEMTPMGAPVQTPERVSQAVVELADAQGRRLRVELPASSLDLVGLAQTFWRQAP